MSSCRLRVNGLSVYFILLNAGVSVEDLQASLRRDDRTRGEATLGLVSIQASASVSAGEPRRAVTYALKPGLTYVVLSETDEEGGGSVARARGLTTLTTSGEANGAAAASPRATVRMVGLRFRGDRVLPRRGSSGYRTATACRTSRSRSHCARA